MAYREALESIAQMLVYLPDESVESQLATFDAVLDVDALLNVSGSELRPLAAEMLRDRAAGCPNPTRRDRLLRAASDVLAGHACGRTAEGLTSKEAREQLAGIPKEWQPPADPVWPESPASGDDDNKEEEEEEDPPQPAPHPKPRKVQLTKAEFLKLNTRKASVLQVGGFRPSLEPAASNFGKSPLGLPGEEWPTWQSKPLLFVCQMNLALAPAVPPLLADIRLITFFVNPDLGVLKKENGADWRLRAYPSLEGLVPLVAPAGAPKVSKGFECRWEECEDHPNYDDSEIVIPAGSRQPQVDLENIARTKIGGYASTIQSAPWWGQMDHPDNPKYCLQINSEEKTGFIWGDCGTIYVARGTTPGSLDRWFLDWQCF